MKIGPLPTYKNLITGNKILWKRGDIAPKEPFLLFSHNIFNISLTSRVQLQIHLLNAVRFIFSSSANLICQNTDISKYFRESLGIRDNESRLYNICIEMLSFIFGCLQRKDKTVIDWYIHGPYDNT